MMATYRTPSDSEALGPAVRILLKRVMSDPALGASSRMVMCWLLLEGRDEAPSASDMGHLVGLTERSARRAYAELREAGWLDPKRAWSEAPRADTPERQSVLDGERTELSATLDLPSFREHVAQLEVIRDRALAKGNEQTALSAQTRIGRAMGYDRPQRPDRKVRPGISLLPSGEGARRAGEGKPLRQDHTAEAVPLNRRSAPPSPQGRREDIERLELARSGSERDPAGTELVKAGSNWHELAGLGCLENRQSPEKLRPISVLLEKPIFAAERTEPGRRPSWLNGVSAAALASGQNCPPLPPTALVDPGGLGL